MIGDRNTPKFDHRPKRKPVPDLFDASDLDHASLGERRLGEAEQDADAQAPDDEL